MCVHDKKYAMERSRKCILCTPPVAFSELRLTGREKTQLIWEKIYMAVKGRRFYHECFLEVLHHQVSMCLSVLLELLHRSSLV